MMKHSHEFKVSSRIFKNAVVYDITIDFGFTSRDKCGFQYQQMHQNISKSWFAKHLKISI